MNAVSRAVLALVLLWIGCGAPAAVAAPQAEVEAVQMPAWLVREAKRSPLAPGMQLRPNDRIETGADARVLLRLLDGSMVKLGEKARFGLDAVGGAPGRDGLFRAAMSVIE